MKIYGEIKDITLVRNGVREDGQAYQINAILFEVAGSGDTIVAETFQNNENFANRGIAVGAKGDIYIKMEAKWSSQSMKYWQRTVFDRFDAHIGGQPTKSAGTVAQGQPMQNTMQTAYQQGQMQGAQQPAYQQGQMQGAQQPAYQQGQMPYMNPQQMAQYAPGLMMPPQQQMFQAPMPTNDLPFD